MRELFMPDKTGFTFCRVPIGANDFAESWYSLDEAKGDYAMERFSIERDKGCLLPFIHEARRFSPALQLFASPWSPPTWMKQPPVYNYGRLRRDPKTLAAYALYLEKFLKAFADEGAPVKRLCVQNEVFADQKFPSCLWDGALMRDFIRDYLGPRLESAGLDTEIWLGTINGPFTDYEFGNWHGQSFNELIALVLKDPKAAKYIRGLALQWGGKHVLEEVRAQYPELELFQSECECGDGSNAFASIPYAFNLMWKFFRAGATAFVYWNIALEADAYSTWGWKQNSLVTVDADAGVCRYNPEFYLMKHLSAFARPGARALEVRGPWAANALAFRNPDGRTAAVALNPFDTTERLEADGMDVAMPPHSLNTLVW